MTFKSPIKIWTPARIQFELKEIGITQASIARECGVTPTSISEVINFLTVSDRLMRAVAKKIGADHRDVFAWYYGNACNRSDAFKRRTKMPVRCQSSVTRSGP